MLPNHTMAAALMNMVANNVANELAVRSCDAGTPLVRTIRTAYTVSHILVTNNMAAMAPVPAENVCLGRAFADSINVNTSVSSKMKPLSIAIGRRIRLHGQRPIARNPDWCAASYYTNTNPYISTLYTMITR